MKITPLEIRQKNFEKKLRGYDKDEVNAFLLSLSNEWERVLDENKELKIKLDQSEKEVEKLREVENSLFKTLKTAEDTGANLIDQANKAAELHLKETQMNAEGLMSESKEKARGIIERAELQAKEMIEEMQEAVKDLENNYRTLEAQRDNLLAELKILSEDILDRLQRSAKQSGPFKVQDHMKRVREMVRESEDRINAQRLELTKVIQEDIPAIDPKNEESSKKLEEYITVKSSPKEVNQEGKGIPQEERIPEPIIPEKKEEPEIRNEPIQPDPVVEEEPPVVQQKVEVTPDEPQELNVDEHNIEDSKTEQPSVEEKPNVYSNEDRFQEEIIKKSQERFQPIEKVPEPVVEEKVVVEKVVEEPEEEEEDAELDGRGSFFDELE